MVYYNDIIKQAGQRAVGTPISKPRVETLGMEKSGTMRAVSTQLPLLILWRTYSTHSDYPTLRGCFKMLK